MTMKKKFVSYGLAALGLVLLGAGLFLLKTLTDPQGMMRPLPYILLGVGCGVFGHGAGEVFSQRMLKKHPDVQKQMEIERRDERNVAIADRAKAKAFDLMLYVFGALMVSFALMNVDLAVTLLLVAAYLFVVGCGLYYRFRYEKEM